MRKKVCCILMLITLLLNSSVMLVISQAVDAVQNIVNKDKTKVFAEVNLTKYENYDTTTENSSTGSKGTLAQFNLKTGINFEEGENYTPIKKTSVNIEVPKIGNYNPTRVEVITKSTKATNGGKDAKYEYNSNTGILQITAENNDYTENVSEARDEYEIICIYKSECYTKDEKRNLNVKANVEETLKDDSETKISAKVEQKFEVQENVNGVISIVHEANNLYDGYIKANTLNSENKYETSYKETAKIMISNKDVAQKIEVKEVSEDSLYTDSIIENGEEYTKKFVALPNASEHQTGLGIDMTSQSVVDKQRLVFGDTTEYKWVVENCAKYGFIVRFTEGTDGITGISHEPWHLRYVGKKVAKEIKDQNWTLEEYCLYKNVIPKFKKD